MSAALLAQLTLGLGGWLFAVAHHARRTAAEEQTRWDATEDAWRALLADTRRGRVL